MFFQLEVRFSFKSAFYHQNLAFLWNLTTFESMLHWCKPTMSWFFLRRWIRDWFQLRSRLAAEPECLIYMRRQLKKKRVTTGYLLLVIQTVSYRHRQEGSLDLAELTFCFSHINGSPRSFKWKGQEKVKGVLSQFTSIKRSLESKRLTKAEKMLTNANFRLAVTKILHVC